MFTERRQRARASPAHPSALLPMLGLFLALLIGATNWRTLHQPVDPVDAAPAPSMPTVIALDPTGFPTSAVIAAPQVIVASAEIAT